MNGSGACRLLGGAPALRVRRLAARSACGAPRFFPARLLHLRDEVERVAGLFDVDDLARLELAREQLLGERILDEPLNGALERACTRT